jgi:hypothetical protein
MENIVELKEYFDFPSGKFLVVQAMDLNFFAKNFVRWINRLMYTVGPCKQSFYLLISVRTMYTLVVYACFFSFTTVSWRNKDAYNNAMCGLRSLRIVGAIL